jgi:D-alanyl-D-alanine endopeptidase (penicillin-binding protein 7)
LASQSVIVVDAISGKLLYQKNADQQKSIASITKLMTAMVALDAKLPMDEKLTIDSNDLDRLKMTTSRLPLGTTMTRREMLHLALMSSENRTASALARHYPGGKSAFLAAMNAKARALGMSNTHFADSTGLTPKNVSTAADLAKLVAAASEYPLIRQFTTDHEELVRVAKAGTLQYRNTNVLVRQGNWKIDVSKTGYINEAGRCLVMQAHLGNRPAYMVFLKSGSRGAPMADAQKVKKWLESGAAGINLAGL